MFLLRGFVNNFRGRPFFGNGRDLDFLGENGCFFGVIFVGGFVTKPPGEFPQEVVIIREFPPKFPHKIQVWELARNFLCPEVFGGQIEFSNFDDLLFCDM